MNYYYNNKYIRYIGSEKMPWLHFVFKTHDLKCQYQTLVNRSWQWILVFEMEMLGAYWPKERCKRKCRIEQEYTESERMNQ